MFFPVIKRVSPELTVSGKIIRRYTGDSDGFQVVVHLKQGGARPNVRTVHRHEDWDIAENLDVARVRIDLEGKPLLEELKLVPRLSLRLVTQSGSCNRFFCFSVVTELVWPKLP